MRKPYVRGFDVAEMLQLRLEGWTFVALGLRYGKDHSTIIYHCRKHGLVTESTIDGRKVRLRIRKAVPVRKTAPGNPTWDSLLREHFCCGSRGRHRHLVYCPAYGIPAPLPPPKKPHKYDYIFMEKVNDGKSYHEYLEDAKKRPVEKAYMDEFGDMLHVPATLRPH